MFAGYRNSRQVDNVLSGFPPSPKISIKQKNWIIIWHLWYAAVNFANNTFKALEESTNDLALLYVVKFKR